MFIISISFLTNCQSINRYLVMCLSDSAMAYSAITVFPDEVWAAINTLSWFSRCNIACFWNTSNSNGHWNEIIKTFCQFFFYYKILITVVSPVIWPQALVSINGGPFLPIDRNKFLCIWPLSQKATYLIRLDFRMSLLKQK